MRELSVRRRTCKACRGSRPGTATLAECSSLPANRPLASLPLSPETPVLPGHEISFATLENLRQNSPRAFVSRAYIRPKKPKLEASFRYLPGFLGVCWKWESGRIG